MLGTGAAPDPAEVQGNSGMSQQRLASVSSRLVIVKHGRQPSCLLASCTQAVMLLSAAQVISHGMTFRYTNEHILLTPADGRMGPV